MRSLFLIPLVLATFSMPAYALEDADFFPRTNRVVLTASQYNPLGSDGADHRTALGVEYRFATVPVFRWFHPWIGFEQMGRQVFWIGGGLESDIHLSENWVLTVQTGPGYMNDGDQNKIANIWPSDGLLFRSRGELSYILGGSGARIGLNIGHISNARTSDSNPGIESVGINLELPVDILGGN